MENAERSDHDFLVTLQGKLAVRSEWLEKTRVPMLIVALRSFRALFGALYGTLSRKGAFREDRYEYDSRPDEIVIPVDTPIPEGAEADMVGIRLSAYRHQLDFLADSYHFSLNMLDTAALKKISSLISYIDWSSFGDASRSPTTRALARLVSHVRLSPDVLSVRVLQDSQTQIQSLARDIGLLLAEVEAWNRESWKAGVRARVLTAFAARATHQAADSTEELLVLKKAFDESLPGGLWQPELAQEILAEDHAEDSAARRQKLLNSLGIPHPAARIAEAVPYKKELLVAVRGLSQVAGDLAAAETILVENEHALEKQSLSFFQRVRRWFRKSLGRLDDRFYKIEFRESSKKGPRAEKVNFLRFVAELREIKGILNELADESSAESRRIEACAEEELCDFLDWEVRKLQGAHRRLEGLNELFRLRVAHERGGRPARSISLELLRIENSLARADKVRHECIDRMEKKSK